MEVDQIAETVEFLSPEAALEAVRLRRELEDVLAPIDVVVVDRDLARRRAAVRGTLVERALREGRVLADT